MASPLIRIPFVVAAAVALYRAATPPHPPSSVEEKAPSTSLEGYLKSNITSHVIKVSCLLNALAEVAVILGTHYPRNPLAGPLLSSFVCNDIANAQNIRLTFAFFLGTCMVIAGSCLRLACYRALGHLFTFEMSIRKGHRLVTSGPYGVVRHPGYTGALLGMCGIFLWQCSSGSWMVECNVLESTIGRLAAFLNIAPLTLVTIGLLQRMFKEDEQLQKTFGREWDDWAKRVPCLIIPWLY